MAETQNHPARQIGDPSDKATDAAADGQFTASGTAHRGGYGDMTTKLRRAIHFAEKGGTLAAGEGQLIVAYYDAQLCAAMEEAVKWRRRFYATRGEEAWVEKHPRDGRPSWLQPDMEYRAVDLSVGGVFYAPTMEAAADALADFWEQYERDSAAAAAVDAPVAADAGNAMEGGADAITDL